jgi:biopolymer transport protein ExbD
MSDIAFLLLIFIMVLSLINYKKHIDINYAGAEFQETTQRDKNFEIWIDKDGKTYYKGRIIKKQKLIDTIKLTIFENPDTRFHIISDKSTNVIIL